MTVSGELTPFLAQLSSDFSALLTHPERSGPALLEIAAINVVLSGDNAVVIALACRGLPADRRRLGLLLGSGVAIVLRIVFTVLIAALLATPFLKIAASLLLLYVAVKLVVVDEEPDADKVKPASRLWGAVRTIAVADAIMSLDNVLAIAAAAHGSPLLLVVGLLISIPLIVAGAAIIAALLDRLPILLWAGAALLGWAAGGLFVSDPWLVGRLGETRADALEIPAAAAGAVLVVAVAAGLRWRRGTLAASLRPSRESSGPASRDSA